MRKFIPLSILCAATMVNCACSSETHYDSVSTSVTIDVTKVLEDDQKITLHHRFQFDRDLIPLQSMEIVEAWLAAPEIIWRDDSVEGTEFSLSLIRDMSISVVDQGNGETVYWLFAAPTPETSGQALFTEMNVGDLRQYMSSDMKLEIEIDVTLDPYQAMRYWRDICRLNETCQVRLPLSMQFKMED